MKPERANRRGAVFAIPLALAAITLVGLIAGLVGEGAADVVSWLALGGCLMTIGWAFFARRAG